LVFITIFALCMSVTGLVSIGQTFFGS